MVYFRHVLYLVNYKLYLVCILGRQLSNDTWINSQMLVFFNPVFVDIWLLRCGDRIDFRGRLGIAVDEWVKR